MIFVSLFTSLVIVIVNSFSNEVIIIIIDPVVGIIFIGFSINVYVKWNDA